MVVLHLLFWATLLRISAADRRVVEMEQFHDDAWHPTNTIRFDDTSKPNTNVSAGVVWRNCNKSSVNIYLRGLNTQPYPVPLRKAWHLTDFVLEIKEDVGNEERPVEIAFSLQMLIQGKWVELCEWIRRQHCYLPDMCANFKELFRKCPLIMVTHRLNCTCPIKANVYNFTKFPVPRPIDPPFIIQGRFKVTVVLRTRGRDIGCLNVEFCIQRC